MEEANQKERNMRIKNDDNKIKIFSLNNLIFSRNRYK